jgi:alpha-tubulin suppressor-like RCC1 family protein
MGTTTIAIDDEGVVRMWGAGGSAGGNSNGHTNLSSCTYGLGLHDHRLNIHPQIVPSIPYGAVVVDVSCGLGHALFLLKTGCVWSSGSGGNGRLGLGDTSDRKDPCLLVSLLGESVSAVQCGASHSLALTSTGRVYSWGKNSQGQCGTGHLGEVLRPVPCKTLSSERVVQVAAGWEHSIALTDKGAVYAWGCGYKDNRRGIVPPVLGLGDNNGRTVPERLRAFDSDNARDLKTGPKLGIFGVELEPYRIVSIACGWDHCLALDNGGKVRAWGSGQNGKLGRGNEESAPTPSFILALDHVCVVSIAAGCEHSAAVTDEGVIYTWGHGDGEEWALTVLLIFTHMMII